ncbi:hypothetical protein [Oceanobacillus sp. 1P07AA]|uniref:hypothetical protein n=1 Tax=Oceanobacillus sp. 1P07AA TaxID=3132293 RepID=UPI0039A5F669
MPKEELISALKSDSLNVLNSIVPVPQELIKYAFKRIKNNKVHKYTNLNYQELLDFYYNESESIIDLQLSSSHNMKIPQCLIIDNTWKRYDLEKFRFNFIGSTFEPKQSILDQTDSGFNKLSKEINYTNDENLRLANIIKNGDNYIFETQPVYYKNYLKTNMLMDYPFNKELTLRKKYHSNGSLGLLDNSFFANHLGLNILAFTSGGKLILQQRSSKVAYAPNEIGASISGAVSSSDIKNNSSLADLSIIREGIEELGIERNDIKKNSIQFLGLSRELLRGGKPEMFFSMQVNLSEIELKNKWKLAKDKWETKKLIFYTFDEYILNPITQKESKIFETHINQLLNDYGNKMSIPLLTNLALWIKFKRLYNINNYIN